MRPSLTRRLLTLYLATILVVIGIVGGLVWVMMRRALHAALDDTLRTEALAVASRLEVEKGQVEFDREPPQPDGPRQADSLVMVVDAHGRVVFRSPELKRNRTWMDRVSTAAPGQGPVFFTAPLAPNEGVFRVIALHVRPDAEDDEPATDSAEQGARSAWVLVARPLAPVNAALGQLASVLLVAAGAALLAALVGGSVAARRGTQPIRALAEIMGRVKPGDPGLSLDPARVPLELEPIVATTERLLERVRGELSRQKQLTADVAHDLRTPVAGVRALLDVCLQRERGLSEYAAVIEKARGALRQLSQLLDDVLTLSRLDAGVDQPNWGDASLEEVLSASVATVQPLAAARDVTIQMMPTPKVDLRTDRGKLVKIISNLLSNAVEHSPVGETVCLTARMANLAVELAVTDHGPGVPPDLCERIFDRFVRGDAARASADGHQGLGLPIAAGLARVLGGEVKLDEGSEPGSRFVIRLPVV